MHRQDTKRRRGSAPELVGPIRTAWTAALALDLAVGEPDDDAAIDELAAKPMSVPTFADAARLVDEIDEVSEPVRDRARRLLERAADVAATTDRGVAAPSEIDEAPAVPSMAQTTVPIANQVSLVHARPAPISDSEDRLWPCPGCATQRPQHSAFEATVRNRRGPAYERDVLLCAWCVTDLRRANPSA